MVNVRFGVINIKVLTPEYTHPYHRLMVKALRQFPADFEASTSSYSILLSWLLILYTFHNS